MMKKFLILLTAVLILGGCARSITGGEDIPPPPSKEAIWVYGHYDSQGNWIPGRWVE